MKIEKGYSTYEKVESRKNTLPSTTKTSTTKHQNVHKSVDVALSKTSQAIKQQVTDLEESPVRADKVAALKAAIQNGTYEISPEKIAKNMLTKE